MTREMRRPSTERALRGPSVGPGLRLLAALAFVAVLAAAAPSSTRAQTMDDHVFTYVGFDELEYAGGLDERPVEFDGQAWIGGDFHRLRFNGRGHVSTMESGGDLALEALYSRVVHPFWNLQGGVGVDHAWGGGSNTRGLLAVGLEGLAPYWFEVAAFLYASQDGDLSARVEAGYELLLTQRLVLEPEIEFALAVQEVPAFGVASGLDGAEAGLRLRYEIVPELAPYVGLTWSRDRVPGTSGGSVSEGSFVAGLRWWY